MSATASPISPKNRPKLDFDTVSIIVGTLLRQGVSREVNADADNDADLIASILLEEEFGQIIRLIKKLDEDDLSWVVHYELFSCGVKFGIASAVAAMTETPAKALTTIPDLHAELKGGMREYIKKTQSANKNAA